MKYYFVSLDKDYTDFPKPINWFGKIDVESIFNGKYEKLEKAYLFEIKENMNLYQTDIITEPTFAVSKLIKYCLEKYEPNMKFTRLYFVQRKQEKVLEYFIPHIEVENGCINKNSNLFINKPQIYLKELAEDKNIFKITDGRTNYIIFKSELLESIYRRGAKGLHIEKVETIN